jgi:hypothetical protein
VRGWGNGQRHHHRKAVATGDIGVVTILIALAIGAIVWKVSTALIRIVSTPPPEVDPEDVVEVDQDFRCSVCGTEITMRVANAREQTAPKHCREEMDPVWRP